MLKWEYWTVDAFTKEPAIGEGKSHTYYVEWNKVIFKVDDFLNLFGNDGWELAAVYPFISRILEPEEEEDPTLVSGILYTYHFKRMRDE